MYRTKKASFSIFNRPKGKLLGLPFGNIKKAILGEKYELNLIFIKNKESKRLNLLYRKKNKPANVLSFPLEKNLGEIFIDLDQAKKESGLYDKTNAQMIGLLFIHALFHLKGLKHGSTMERIEKRLRKKFKLGS